jgi:CO dehydrogenase maturation factor
MTKQEYIDWTLQETLISLYGETDLIVAGPILTKECSCFAGGLINSALSKLISGYDFVIFDSEYDLEYLRNLTAYQIDAAVIISLPTTDGVFTSFKIKQSSLLNCSPGQIGLILNKVQNSVLTLEISDICDEYDLDIIGVLPYDESLENNSISKVSPLLNQKVRELVYRLNLPKI